MYFRCICLFARVVAFSRHRLGGWPQWFSRPRASWCQIIRRVLGVPFQRHGVASSPPWTSAPEVEGCALRKRVARSLGCSLQQAMRARVHEVGVLAGHSVGVLAHDCDLGSFEAAVSNRFSGWSRAVRVDPRSSRHEHANVLQRDRWCFLRFSFTMLAWQWGPPCSHGHRRYRGSTITSARISYGSVLVIVCTHAYRYPRFTYGLVNVCGTTTSTMAYRRGKPSRTLKLV